MYFLVNNNLLLPYRCCVPCCKGNYPNSPKVSVFGFPADNELKNKRLNAIKRDNFKLSKTSKVCELHFQKLEIQTSVHMFDEKTGKEISAPLSYPSNISRERRSYVELRRRRLYCQGIDKAIAASFQTLEAYNEAHSLSIYDELKSISMNLVVAEEWIMLKKDNSVNFILLKNMRNPVVK